MSALDGVFGGGGDGGLLDSRPLSRSSLGRLSVRSQAANTSGLPAQLPGAQLSMFLFRLCTPSEHAG